MVSKNQVTSSTPEVVPVKPGLSALTKGVFSFLVFFALLGFAGNSDYTDEVYYSIPDVAFEEIVLKLGDHATRSEVVDEYVINKTYYDSFVSYDDSEVSLNFE